MEAPFHLPPNILFFSTARLPFSLRDCEHSTVTSFLYVLEEDLFRITVPFAFFYKPRPFVVIVFFWPSFFSTGLRPFSYEFPPKYSHTSRARTPSTPLGLIPGTRASRYRLTSPASKRLFPPWDSLRLIAFPFPPVVRRRFADRRLFSPSSPVPPPTCSLLHRRS